jgi:hypothetical protein
MASLDYYNILDQIVMVLKDFGGFLSTVYFYPGMDEKDKLLSGADDYHKAIKDKNGLELMLRKLDMESIIKMYKYCQLLADKYNLTCKDKLSRDADISISNTTIYDTWVKNRWGHFDWSDDRSYGWESAAPQRLMGYGDYYDAKIGTAGFRLHATYFNLRREKVLGKPDYKITLRLWKGYYGDSGAGGEIGFYGEGAARTNEEIRERYYRVIEEITREITKIRFENEIVSGFTSRYTGIPALEMLGKLNELDRAGLDRETKYKEFADYVVNRAGFLDDPNDKVIGDALESNNLGDWLGLTGTAVQVFKKSDDKRIVEHIERNPEYWTTDFEGPLRNIFRKLQREDIYTVNHFYFRTSADAQEFHDKIRMAINEALYYYYNINDDEKPEPISLVPRGRTNAASVILLYGKTL